MENIAFNSGVKLNKRSKTVLCSNCKKEVTPKVVFYHNEPESSICPNCNSKIKTFRNSSKIEDKLLIKIVAISIVIYFIALLV